MSSIPERPHPSRRLGLKRSASTLNRRSITATSNRRKSTCSIWFLNCRAHPRLSSAWARYCSVEGRLAEAEAYFQAALERDPDYVEALIGLGQVEAQRGDVLAAIKRFETAIEIDPHRSKAHNSLGRLLEAMGNTDEALAEYFRALEFEPNNAGVSLRIAAIQLARKQPDQALRDSIRWSSWPRMTPRRARFEAAPIWHYASSARPPTISARPPNGFPISRTSFTNWRSPWTATTNQRKLSAPPRRPSGLLPTSPTRAPFHTAWRWPRDRPSDRARFRLTPRSFHRPSQLK